MAKFYLEKEYLNGEEVNEINQNLFSLDLLIKSSLYKDAKTGFIIEIFNFYQDLENGKFYKSFSQALTTYILEQMDFRGLIDGEYIKSKYINLNTFNKMFDNYNYKNDTRMYIYYFYKLRSFNKSDKQFIKNMAKALNVDLKNIVISYKDNKMYLKLKREFVIKQIVSQEVLKKVWQKRKFLYDDIAIVLNFYEDTFNEQLRLLKGKKKLYNN